MSDQSVCEAAAGEPLSTSLQCPRCDSEVVEEYRMGVLRYLFGHGVIERFDAVMRGSEDVIYHRCRDCGYGSSSEVWVQQGHSDFDRRPGPTR